MTTRRIVLVGGGGHASDLLGAIEACPDTEALGFVDDADPPFGRFEGRSVPHLGPIDILSDLPLDTQVLIAVGYPGVRRRLSLLLPGDLEPAVLVHPAADIGFGAASGAGSVVLAGARLSPWARLCEHVHVSYLAAVGHDTSVGSFTTIMPGAMISGNVTIGPGVLVGTNATILEGIVIGADATVGAGAVVTHDVHPGATVVGIPARPVAQRE